MPKVVDHEQRRRELAHAVWRVIRRQGVDQASVRTVALEAGWSPGALRHYFATQSELLAFAMRLVVERIEGRIAAIDQATDLGRRSSRCSTSCSRSTTSGAGRERSLARLHGPCADRSRCATNTTKSTPHCIRRGIVDTDARRRR